LSHVSDTARAVGSGALPGETPSNPFRSLRSGRIGTLGVGVPRWILVTAFLTLAVALSSGSTPWIHALSGAFRPPDFAADIAAVRAVAAGSHPFTPDFKAQHAQAMGVAVEEGYPFFPHPPSAVLLFRPLASLSLSAAALIWFAVSLWLLFILARVLVETATGTYGDRDETRVRGSAVLGAFALLLLWPPVLYNLEKGQLSILLAVLIAMTWRSLLQKRLSLSGVWLGAATAVKVFPLLLGGYLLVRAPRALAYLVASAGLFTVGALAWMGLDALPAYLQHSSDNLSYWQTWPAVSYSLYGAAARLFIGGRWAEPIVYAPAIARSLVAGMSLCLIACATIVTWRGSSSDGREGARFAAWATLLVLLNPLAMGHNGVLLALPIVLLVRELVRDRRMWPRLAWSAGVVLASIPRQTLVSLAPSPVDPSLSLSVIALPMWGTLLLFGVALTLTRADEYGARLA
jgi:glycosyl transferase family 87